jgi:hypothetical protein
MARAWKRVIDVTSAVRYWEETEDFEGFKRRYLNDLIEPVKLGILPKTLVAPLKRVKTPDGWDRAINRLYDYCDAARIWVKTF